MDNSNASHPTQTGHSVRSRKRCRLRWNITMGQASLRGPMNPSRLAAQIPGRRLTICCSPRSVLRR
jgi:hypothetical protein